MLTVECFRVTERSRRFSRQGATFNALQQRQTAIAFCLHCTHKGSSDTLRKYEQMIGLAKLECSSKIWSWYSRIGLASVKNIFEIDYTIWQHCMSLLRKDKNENSHNPKKPLKGLSDLDLLQSRTFMIQAIPSGNIGWQQDLQHVDVWFIKINMSKFANRLALILPHPEWRWGQMMRYNVALV
jgi:hypothetical protein